MSIGNLTDRSQSRVKFNPKGIKVDRKGDYEKDNSYISKSSRREENKKKHRE